MSFVSSLGKLVALDVRKFCLVVRQQLSQAITLRFLSCLKLILLHLQLNE